MTRRCDLPGTANNTLVSIEGPSGTYTANTSYHLTQDPTDQGPNGDANLFLSIEGSDEAAGSWKVTIPQLVRDRQRRAGHGTIESEPMVVTVEVP